MKNLKRLFHILIILSSPAVFYDVVYMQNSTTLFGYESWRVFLTLFCVEMMLDSLSNLLKTFLPEGGLNDLPQHF